MTIKWERRKRKKKGKGRRKKVEEKIKSKVKQTKTTLSRQKPPSIASPTTISTIDNNRNISSSSRTSFKVSLMLFPSLLFFFQYACMKTLFKMQNNIYVTIHAWSLFTYVFLFYLYLLRVNVIFILYVSMFKKYFQERKKNNVNTFLSNWCHVLDCAWALIA